MTRRKHPRINDLKQKNSELLSKNQELNTKIESQKVVYEEANKKMESDWQSKYSTYEESKNLEIVEKDKQIEERDELVKQKQLQLDQKELKKLARAYSDQEIEYKNDTSFWVKCLSYAGVLLLASATASVYFSHKVVWYERFEYYLADLVLFSAVWFCASHYSDSVKLRNDYANRKTIAQSFGNILHNLEEDGLIKNKFIEKAVDVLCAPSYISSKEPILSKEVLKQIIELGKIASSK